MKLKITEINGWSKIFDITKAITRIGSAPFVDIQLPSNSIAPLHLQILSDPDLPTGCRIVNMATLLEIRNSGATQPFPSSSTSNIQNGDEIQLGEYLLTFILEQSATLLHTSSSIEASLSFIDTMVQPNLPLDGILTVKNLGKVDACQFQVMVSGLPESCFRINPIPLLYPGAREDVPVHLFHHITYPIAGHHDLILTISAPDAYPGEEVIIRQGVYVAPFFKQSMEIMDDLSTQTLPEAELKSEVLVGAIPERETGKLIPLDYGQKQVQAVKPAAVTSRRKKEPSQGVDKNEPAAEVETLATPQIQEQSKNPIVSPKPVMAEKVETQQEITTDEVNPEKNEPFPSQKPDISKVKVIGKQTEQFWDEN